MTHISSKKIIKLSVLLVSIAASFLFISFTKNEKKEVSLPFLEMVDAVVEDEMIKQEIYGCAVGVVKDGQIVHVKTYGYHDRLRSKPIEINSVFRWASVSKTLTAVAAFKAIESGKMKLDDKVTKYVPYWPKDGNKENITIRNLLNNRSGIEHYNGDRRFLYYAANPNNNFDAKRCVSTFSYKNLIDIPDNANHYTTFGFNLLGAAIEEATGVPYETYIKNNIGSDANMQSLTAKSNDQVGYKKDCNGFLSSVDEGDVMWKLPGGGWASNIEDFTKFLQGLINGTFLNNTSAIWQPVANNKNYCYGSNLIELDKESYVFHGGDHANLRTNLAFQPNSKFGVVIMVNGAKYIDRDRFSHKIEEVFGKIRNTSPLPVNECIGVEKCGDNGDKTMGVWRKTDKAEGTLIRRGYNNDEFHSEWKLLLDKGYWCSHIETYEKNGIRRWDGIFKKTTKKSAMIRNYTHHDFNEKWKELSNQGYRLVDIETYADGFINTNRKWAGLFIQMDGGYYLHQNMSQQQLHDKWIDYGKKGMKLIDIERYGDKWAGVWVQGEDVAMVRNYKTIAFRDKRRELNERGWRLIDVDTYMDGSTRKWSGLWKKSDLVEHFLFDAKYCDWLETYHRDYINKGYELIDMETY
jgi:CubicO group peptidase (beta-lactamase class C family)